MVRLVEALQPIYQSLPEIRAPGGELTLKTKVMWSAAALLLYYIMGRIQLIGIDPVSLGQNVAALQVILASEIGSLITAGISPIVLSSIILQLMVGGKLLDLNLTDPADRARFTGLQKLFAIVLSVFEGFIYPLSGFVTPNYAAFGAMALPFVAAQIALGSIFVVYLDELVSKYGIGSGIGLFIAGGVTQQFFWQAMRPAFLPIYAGALPTPAGNIPAFFGELLSTGNFAFVQLLPVILAIILFMLIIWVQGIHVNIPITMGRRGTGGRYPVKFLYVSVMPVILAVALFANVQLLALMMRNLYTQFANVPVLNIVLGALDTLFNGSPVFVLGGQQPGLLWATQTPFNLFSDVYFAVSSSGLADGFAFMLPQIIQGIVYTLLLVVLCVVFGRFWVALGGQGPEDVANQLQSSGMYIPGFRRDKRIIIKVLERYIPPITILGSIFVGLLAGIGNMALGTLTSGTGILLTASIVYRMYEEVAKQQLMETHPILKRILG